MTYKEIVTYIEEIPRFTRKHSLAHTSEMLLFLGNPQNGKKIIHVAGTNGKGSVCAYLDAMLRAEGKSTGLFTSPHLVKMNERIVLNGKQISDEGFCEVFEETMQAVRRMQDAGLEHPTFFEFLFAMAMKAYDRAGMEYIVLETGLGGRLDATSSVEPVACVITSIGLDHMEYLGDTVEQIAGEKAGIIRPEVPVFFAQTAPESDSVIEKTAEKEGCFCKKIGKDAYEILGIEDKHIAFSCLNDYYGTTTWKLNNIGLYQPHNALLAMEVMRGLFGENGHPHLWKEALEAVRWRGRMEEVLPGVYVDGAHNISAVKAFAETVEKAGFADAVLFSAVRDKDYEEMIKYLCEHTEAACYIVTQIEDARGTRADELGVVFRKYTDKPVRVIGSVKDAFEYAVSSRRGGNVYCLGSLYLTGMIEGYLGSRENQIRGGR